MGAGYRDAGSGEAVVLLHGSLGSKGQWRALVERLAPQWRAVAVDLHGYGDNALPRFRQRHSFGHEVALVTRRLAEIEACGRPLRRFHLVGHSFGAGVALELARRFPAHVASLALYEPPCFPLLPEGDADLAAARAIGAEVSRHAYEGRGHEALRGFLEYWGGPGSYEALAAEAREALAARAPKAALDFDAVFDAPRDAREWSVLAMPVLLLRGARSPAGVRRAVALLAGALPNARLEELAGDHLMPVRDPGPVNDAIVRFLDTLRWIEASRPRAYSPRPSPASWAATMA